MLLNVKGIEIETGKPYSSYNERELAVLPPKTWEGSDLYMILTTYPDGELKWTFSSAYDD